MKDVQKKAIDLISLNDEAFFSFRDADVVPLQNGLEALWPEPRPSRRPGADEDKSPRTMPALLAIAAPRRIDMKIRTQVPVLVASCQSGQRQWEVKYDQNTWMAAVDLKTGRVHIGQPFLPEKRLAAAEPSMSGPGPDRTDMRALTSSVRKVDLAAVMGLGKHPSRFAITAMVYDWKSNTIVTELVGEQNEAVRPPGLGPSEFLKSSMPAKMTPALTEERLSLAVPDRIEKKGPIIIHGAACVPLPESASISGEEAVSGAEDRKRAAIVPGALLLLKKDAPFPIVVDIHIPLHSEMIPKIGDMVDLFFSFDLRDTPGGEDISGNFQVFLLIGEDVSGPFQLEVY